MISHRHEYFWTLQACAFQECAACFLRSVRLRNLNERPSSTIGSGGISFGFHFTSILDSESKSILLIAGIFLYLRSGSAC